MYLKFQLNFYSQFIFPFQLLGVGVAAGVAFIIFPWWFAVIHLFAVLNRTAESYGMGYNNNYDMTNTE